MDLNRPFGNGRDDDGDYIVDETDESEERRIGRTFAQKSHTSIADSRQSRHPTNGTSVPRRDHATQLQRQAAQLFAPIPVRADDGTRDNFDSGAINY